MINKERVKNFILFLLLFAALMIFSYFCPVDAESLQIPNRDLTPGDTFNVTAKEVCKRGYSSKIRNVPQSVKNAVYREYSLDPHKPPCPCEVDHLISLELGGSNDIKNLWPEPYSGSYNAHQKDRLENYLHRLVCNGQMDLKTAQEEISKDWEVAYQAADLDHAGNKGKVELNVE